MEVKLSELPIKIWFVGPEWAFTKPSRLFICRHFLDRQEAINDWQAVSRDIPDEEWSWIIMEATVHLTAQDMQPLDENVQLTLF